MKRSWPRWLRHKNKPGPRPALYNSARDAERAIRRAERWLRNQSKGPRDKPPFHIIANAQIADRQFGSK